MNEKEMKLLEKLNVKDAVEINGTMYTVVAKEVHKSEDPHHPGSISYNKFSLPVLSERSER